MKKAKEVQVPLDRPLTPQEAEELLSHAYNSSLWQISNYSRTKAQLIEKLHTKGYPKEAVKILHADGRETTCDMVAETIERLEAGELIDEKRFVEEFVKAKMRAGMGENRIRMLLLQKRATPEIVDEVFESSDEDQVQEALQKTLHRYTASSTFRNTQDEWKKKQKLIQHLLSKGFSYDDISEVVNNYFDWD